MGGVPRGKVTDMLINQLRPQSCAVKLFCKTQPREHSGEANWGSVF